MNTDLHRFRPRPYLRCSVQDVNSEQIVVSAPVDGKIVNAILALRDADDDILRSHEYLLSCLKVGSQLNLLNYKYEYGRIYAEYIIFEPDYLLDISSVAACFDTGSPLQFIVSKLSDRSGSSFSILLGNFASQLLDETLHFPDATRSYAESIRDYFESAALDFALCSDTLNTFHAQAMIQRDNIRRLISETAAKNPYFRPEKSILEPSFFVEMLGLQGRMDLLQSDIKVLIEQKSGQRGFSGEARETHYVQMLLYLAILSYAVGMEPAEISSYLLYSKFSDGMMLERENPALLFSALRMRNLIVAKEFRLATDKDYVRELFLTTQADDLRCNPALSDRFWLTWKQPEIENVLRTIQNASSLEQSYFFRMYRFVAREQMLSRMGDNGVQPTGMSLLWRRSVEERLADGSLLWPLRIQRDDAETSVSKLVLGADETMTIAGSNFREGDAVVAYSLPDDQKPDVRRSVLFRGFIESLQPNCIIVKLSAPQSSGVAFSSGVCYAVEHDSIDMARSQYRGLLSLLSSPSKRRKLWFAQRKPDYDETKRAQGDYGQFQSLVDGACRAGDIYLVVGPPGTGKTSFGMLNILQEELLRPGHSVLITAYTNRAVDEICSKLDTAGIDFLRIGRETSCNERFKDSLLSSRAKLCHDRDELSNIVKHTRVVVATTTTFGRNADLLGIRHFDLCIVDEASQILEPQILPLFAAVCEGQSSIRRFVLIGDHKQLPAVVVQSREDSRVWEPELRDIGLADCRHSLFQRLINRFRRDCPKCIFEMTRQGRMHPEVAEFANRYFYAGNLIPAGLPHQLETLQANMEVYDNNPLALKDIKYIIRGRRFAFFDVKESAFDSSINNSNVAEASLIAEIVRATYSPDVSLGVIVPYRSQISLVRQYIGEDLGITIDTVERYQGSERDIIIYGFTVSTQEGLNFLTAENFHDQEELIDRKLNVALTRARKQLFVVGNAELLQRDKVFTKLIDYARSEHAFVKINAADSVV